MLLKRKKASSCRKEIKESYIRKATYIVKACDACDCTKLNLDIVLATNPLWID